MSVGKCDHAVRTGRRLVQIDDGPVPGWPDRARSGSCRRSFRSPSPRSARVGRCRRAGPRRRPGTRSGARRTESGRGRFMPGVYASRRIEAVCSRTRNRATSVIPSTHVRFRADAHSWLRWAALIAGLLATFAAFTSGASGKADRWGLIFMIAMDLQLLLRAGAVPRPQPDHGGDLRRLRRRDARSRGAVLGR